jgi:PST family polysaccharide transporter
MMEDLKGKAVRGGFVTILGQAAKVMLRMGSLILLARILTPKEFGLVGMVTAITGVLEIMKDAGLSAVTVQRARITNEEISTLFWVNILVGLILGVLTLAIAPVLVIFYHEPRLLWVTMALASGFLFNAAGVQHTALLQRRLRFFALAITEIISLAVSISVGIGMAIGDCGYWSLVGMAVAQPAAYAACVWLATRWIPGKPQRNIGMRSMLKFGGTVTLNTFIVYIAYNIEKVLLGRFWGAEALGTYGRAYQLITFPTGLLNSAVGTVAFPALSRLQDDPPRFKNYFLKGYSLVLAMTIPITLACALFADDIILVLLGPQWNNSIIIFRLLAPTVLIFALINPLGWLLFSTGRVGRSLKIALVLAPLVIVAYVTGLPYGPRGVAFAFSAMMTLWFVPHIAWAIHGTSISLRDIFRTASRPFLAGIATGGLSYGMRLLYGQLLSPFLRLVLGGGIMLVLYLWILLYVMGQKSFYYDIFLRLKMRSSVDNKETERG